MNIYYNGPVLAHAPVTVAAVSGDSLRNGVAYSVPDAIAEILLARPEWGEAPATEAEAEPWAMFVEIDGVDDTIAQAMWDGGYHSLADVVQAVESGGWKKLTGISGIGDARAKKIALWAQEESENMTNG